MKSKNVSVCMIAKNCSDVLPISLKWATDNFEEINIVVDPNNDDDTVEVLDNFENIIVRFHEFDNFSSQKQRALDMATKPYVLLVDSDEIFEEIPVWDSFASRMLQKNDWVSFSRYNLQMDKYHYKLPLESLVVRLMKKENAKMNGKFVDETLNYSSFKDVFVTPYSIIHFGHIRDTEHLKIKGKDRIKFIFSDPCDGPGMKEHKEDWFVVRNNIWNNHIDSVPPNIKKEIDKYYVI